jgi:hypothetical protein
MYTEISRNEELITQKFPSYDENGNEIIGQEISIINKIVKTLVEFNIEGEVFQLEIPHFNPQSEDDIILGIQNREITERRKLGFE